MKGNGRMQVVLRSLGCFVMLGICAWGLAQQSPARKPNELVAGKLIYVASMPDGLDQWISDDLRHWGKYKITSNSEGVDLVIQATNPDQELKLETRGGTAQPKGADRPHLPHKSKNDEPLPTSISVISWVTSQPVWQADILNRKPKKDEADAPAGPHAKIFAHALTADQLAQQVVAKLKEYEEGLEKTPAGNK